jgi:hypothetical protein
VFKDQDAYMDERHHLSPSSSSAKYLSESPDALRNELGSSIGKGYGHGHAYGGQAHREKRSLAFNGGDNKFENENGGPLPGKGRLGGLGRNGSLGGNGKAGDWITQLLFEWNQMVINGNGNGNGNGHVHVH